MKIKKFKFLLIFLTLVLFGISSCVKKISPGSTMGKQGKGYSAAAFDYFYVEAIKQKLMGNGGDALKYLEQCIKIDDKNDAAYYQMAQIVVSNGDLKNGKKFAARAVSLNENNLWYLMMLAGIYYQEKNLDSAIVYYEKAVKNFPNNENLQLTLGNLYSEDQKYEKANLIFNNFDMKYGVNEASTLSEIKNLMSTKKYDEAQVKAELLLKEDSDKIVYNGILAEIYSGKGENQKALDVYNKLIERNPDNPQTQLSLCEFLISNKSYPELFNLLNTIILNENITREEKISLFARLIEIPDLVKDSQDKLIISLMVLESTYSDDDIIPLLRPELLIKQEKLSEASLRLEDIIKIRPDDYYAWEKLLFLYLQMKDYKNLFIRGEECATRFNRSFIAKILFANGAIETGKYPVALEELRKAQILAGENKDSMVQVLTMRADVYYKMKDYIKSFEVFREALKYNTEDLTVINNYAYYLAEQNLRLKEAEEMARKVTEKEKGNNTFLDTYGWVLYKRGKLKEAAKVMESIINSGEKPDAVWYEHYGYILKKQKKCSKAIDSWNTAIRLDSTKTELIKEIENCGK
jgi:Tfp pilus assembly protein PilF